MKIIFSPEYSGNVFLKPENGRSVMMDTVVTNAIGLVNILELRLGLHYQEESEPERLAHYYDAVCQYMASHPDNVMSASFRTSGLSTAKAMLAWRDELRSAGWQFAGAEISKRLEVLVGVEEHFAQQAGCDMAERMRIVVGQVKERQLSCREMVVEMTVDRDLLKPAIRTVLDAIEAQGATIEVNKGAETAENNLSKVRNLIASGNNEKITLDKNDDSIRIWKFADDHRACEYLAYTELNDVDVWVNADNKQMDNWLMLMNKPMCGSVTADCAPQLIQLFVLGLGLFARPINVNTLIEWLNMPEHPIEKYFCNKLADSIVKEGGYINDECKALINRYIDGDFVYLTPEEKALPENKQEEIRKKDKKKRAELAKVFLPSLNGNEPVKTEAVRRFVTELAAWARQRAHMRGEKSGNEQTVEQLMAVSGMCDVVNILLSTIKEETLDYKILDSWMSSVYRKDTFTNAVAEKGCRNVVDSPAKIASLAGTTVWVGVDGDNANHRECSFLYPSERNNLVENDLLQLRAEEAENAYNEQVMLTPLRMTKDKLILVVREHIGGESAVKHPLMVRLEQQVENFDDIVERPSIGADLRRKVEQVSRGLLPAEMKFDHADKLRWPEYLSPTTIEVLAEYPFDYLMQYMLNITPEGKAKMADVRTTKGNVAHAVIEALFAPRNEKRDSSPEEIAGRIAGEFDTTFAQVVEAKGALLQLAENKLDTEVLRVQLRTCLDNLLQILRNNGLKVTGCERLVEGHVGLGLQNTPEDNARDMVGFIDMTLEDSEGHPVVFDFKWTTWTSGYCEKLEENRSIQLEFYRYLLTQEKHDIVNRVAYFLMPEGQLYSKEVFEGDFCHKIDPENNNDIVEQIKNSVEYRKAQLDSGVVETMGEYDSLSYVKSTEKCNLYPLQKEGEPVTNKQYFFSQYNLFK
ncbi:MAG: PD-(D/E)XK nuclease family protein [bacterium]|nr:PD-(D/E)XK nuclease family protein [bacterium]